MKLIACLLIFIIMTFVSVSPFHVLCVLLVPKYIHTHTYQITCTVCNLIIHSKLRFYGESIQYFKVHTHTHTYLLMLDTPGRYLLAVVPIEKLNTSTSPYRLKDYQLANQICNRVVQTIVLSF